MVCCALPLCRAQQPQQVLNKDDQWRISRILSDAHDEVKKHYYDPKVQGLDWDARYQQYSAKIAKAIDLGDGFRIVAGFLEGLQDSHTYFVPPRRATRYDYGFRYTLIGNSCYVTHIRPGTDAASKLHVGDQLLLWDGYNINREDFQDLFYFFDVLPPEPQIPLDVRTPAGETRRMVVNTVVRRKQLVVDLTQSEGFSDEVRLAENENHAERSQWVQVDDLMIWKLQNFEDTKVVDSGIGQARKHKALVLDLRGNPGGSVDTLKELVGLLFDHDVQICDRVGKKETRQMVAKHLGNPYKGDLVVLVDAGSASAAELLARVIQLEHRGRVIGDKSAGAVMEAQYYPEHLGTDTAFFYGFSVTDANLLMSDEKSLEKTGVTPDEVSIPTGADLAVGRDPVIARAAETLGVKLNAEDAGKMFSFEWLPM